MKEMFAYKNQKKLRWGYTTGTCAAAASLAAALMLLGKKRIVQVRLTVPKGIELELEIEDIQAGNGWVSCAVRKDGGMILTRPTDFWYIPLWDTRRWRRNGWSLNVAMHMKEMVCI